MAKQGLLIVNLGSPNSTQVKDVKKYLKQFLMDGDVIDIPWVYRYPLVNWIIAPFRAPKSAHAYEAIFTERGSPLKFHTQDFTEGLKPFLKNEFQEVRYAMRYAEPSIPSVLKDMKANGVEEFYILPMYPQFAKSSTRTVLTQANNEKLEKAFTLLDFFSDPEFIASYQTQIQRSIDEFKPDHLLLSYHGLPESHVKEFGRGHCLVSKTCCEVITEKNRFCYRAQCVATSNHLLRGLPKDLSHTVGFQSRLGRQEWIKPYTDKVILDIAKQGKKRVLVACPAFVADCLETLEEIGIRLKEDFIKSGGEDLRLVPSLNSEDFWVKAFSDLIKRRKKAFLPLKNALEKVQS